MLKFSILFSVAVVFCAGRYHGSYHDGSSEYQHTMDIMELITRNGYPAENITVQTKDGYLMDLIRIRHGIHEYQNHNQQNQYQNQQYQNQHFDNQQYQDQNQQYQNGQYQNQHFDNQQYQNQQYQGQEYQNQQSRNQHFDNQQYQNQQSQDQQYQEQQYQNQHYQNQNFDNRQYQDQQYQHQNQQYQNQQYQNPRHQNQQSQAQSSVESSWYKKKRGSSESSESQSSSSEEQQQQQQQQQQGVMRPAVLLMHGLLSSAEDFVLGGPTAGLAYIMADSGYDVFLGNVRGSKYGRKHTVLDPERDSAFWKYCWDDIGMKDLPAIIDKILKIVRQPKLYYVGHMEGSTIFYVMASEKPEYNDKMHAMVTLGPVAFMGHTTNDLLKLISEKQHNKGWIMRHLGANEFKPTQEIITQGGERECMEKMNNERMCENVFFLLNGYNSRNLNSTIMKSVMKRVPAGSSTKQILHYAQLVKSGRFAKFSMEGQQGDDYDLSRITTPMGMYYTPSDSLSMMTDVDKLTRKLPTLKQTVRVERLTNNMGLLYAKDVDDIIYRPMLKMMKNIDNNPSNNMY